MTCCDPPVDPLAALPDQWRCQSCKAKQSRDEPNAAEPGIWTKVLEQLHTRNPAAFALPKKLRDYFEGVVTTDEGEYDELPTFKLTK